MAPHISKEQKARIVTKLEDGWSLSAVAQHFNVSRTTVFSINKRWRELETLERKRGSGRRRVSLVHEDQALLQVLENDPFESAKNARILSQFPGSQSTVCRRIKASHLKCRIAAKKTELTPQQKQARLIFALNFRLNEQQFWDRVIFSDEKIFQSSKKGKIKVYRPDNQRFNPRFVDRYRASGHFSVNVWGWISSRGMGVVWRIEGRFVALTYREILENIMVPSVEQLYPENNYIFQHDNCPVHTANIVTQWIQNAHIESLPWPSNSPDINPIENIWGVIVKRLYRRNFMPQNSEELWQCIQEVWEELSLEENFITRFMTMGRRLQAVIDADGDCTKY